MESFSSEFAFQSINVINNTSDKKSHQLQGKCFKICGESCSQMSLTASEKSKKFFSRIYNFKHMDFEYALWQMVNIFSSPQKLYRNFSYHHSTRNQWARDDPAFLILLIPWVFASSVAISAILRISFVQWIKLFLWFVFIDCILSGLVVSTFLWIITNRWMIRSDPSKWLIRHSRRFSAASSDDSSEDSQLAPPDVEWAYAFDIHLNSYFPCVIILHILQLPLVFVIRKQLFFSCVVGNAFWLVAALFYIYITFLGYKALPFLKNTRVILLSGTLFVLVYIVSVSLKLNITAGLYKFYSGI